MFLLLVVFKVPLPFKCLQCYHPGCLTDWKTYGSTKGDGEGCPNYYFLCKSIILDKYNDMYDYDLNMNRTVTKSSVNQRNKSVVVLDLVSRYGRRKRILLL